jgi:hypothetical protein
MRVLSIALALGAAVLLTGCADNLLNMQQGLADRYSEVEAEREQLGQITRVDLEEALRSADVHGDVVAATCWAAMIDVLDEAGEEGFFTEPKGVFSTFQKVRNTRRILSDEVSTKIKIGCAALKEETRDRFLSIFRVISPL